MYKENGYTRSLSGLIYAAKRLELVEQEKQREVKRHDRRYPELSVPGEKVQIDVKEVPYCCLISDTEECPFDKELRSLGIKHKLIAPRTPWHNGKVERSHRNDQKYFYDRETFRSIEDFNKKLAQHLLWSNNKSMRTLKDKSPRQLLAEKLAKK